MCALRDKAFLIAGLKFQIWLFGSPRTGTRPQAIHCALSISFWLLGLASHQNLICTRDKKDQNSNCCSVLVDNKLSTSNVIAFKLSQCNNKFQGNKLGVFKINIIGPRTCVRFSTPLYVYVHLCVGLYIHVCVCVMHVSLYC